MNLYGFGGGDPINHSDPFGLCPPDDDDPCNTSTGDANLDTPKSRYVMERGYKNAGTDAGGYSLEAGGACYQDGECIAGTGATREHINIAINGKRKVGFDWHTHGNVGRVRESGIAGDMYTEGPSGPDIGDAEMVYRHPILKMLGNASYPSYIVDKNHIYRLTPGADGSAAITTFERWKKP